MNRRGFLTAAAASIFVPQFGRFFREGSGTLWRPEQLGLVHIQNVAFRTRRWTAVTRHGLFITGTTIESDLYGHGTERYLVEAVDRGQSSITLRPA